MFERSLRKDDLGLRRSLLEKDLESGCVESWWLLSVLLERSEWEDDFQTAVLGLGVAVSVLARLCCEAVRGLLCGRVEDERSV